MGFGHAIIRNDVSGSWRSSSHRSPQSPLAWRASACCTSPGGIVSSAARVMTTPPRGNLDCSGRAEQDLQGHTPAQRFLLRLMLIPLGLAFAGLAMPSDPKKKKPDPEKIKNIPAIVGQA